MGGWYKVVITDMYNRGGQIFKAKTLANAVKRGLRECPKSMGWDFHIITPDNKILRIQHIEPIYGGKRVYLLEVSSYIPSYNIQNIVSPQPIIVDISNR